MRNILKVLTVLWLGSWLFIGIGIFLATPESIKEDKTFIKDEVKPSVIFVEKFKEVNKRLPTTKEFNNWNTKNYVSYIRQKNEVVLKDQKKFKNANWTKDYAIGVRRFEWIEYYFSWSDEYDSVYYNWYDGYIGLIVCIVFGFLPFIFWWRNSKKSST